MRGFLATVYYTTLATWRDKSTLIMLVLFPIALILILGNALESVMSAEPELDPISSAYYGEDEALYDFLQGENIAKYIQTVKVADKESAISEVDSGVYTCSIIEEGDILRLYIADGEQLSNAHIVYNILESYTGITHAVELRIANGDFEAIGDIDFEKQLLEKVPLTAKQPSAIDYYAVTMTVMIIIYAGYNTLDMFHKGLFQTVGERIKVSPLKRAPMMLSFIVSGFFSCILQVAAIMLFSHFAYGVNWGDNIFLVIGVMLAMCFFVQALTLFFILLTKSDKATTGLITAFAFISTFVSKGYTKFYFSDELEKIFSYAPSALAQNAIFGHIYGGDANIIKNVGVLLGAGILMFALSIPLVRRVSK